MEHHPAKAGVSAVLTGITLNASLALIKGITGWFGNSYALIADAVESLMDVFSSMVVYYGLTVSTRPPDENHPYGHGKAEPLAAVAVSMALFIAAFEIARHSIHEIQTPHAIPHPATLVVLLAVIVIKELLFRYVLRTALDIQSTALQGDAFHHRSDALTSAAAFIGIAIALIGGKGWESADDWAALLASLFIAYNAYNLLRPALYELSDAAPHSDLSLRIKEVAREVPGVVGLHHCFVRKMGFDYYVDLDVIVDRNIKVYEGHDIAHAVQNEIRSVLPRVSKVLVHVEPSDPALPDPL